MGLGSISLSKGSERVVPSEQQVEPGKPRKKSRWRTRLLWLACLLGVGAIVVWYALPTGSRRALLPGDTQSILEHADHFELLSLEPSLHVTGDDHFQGYVVRGRAVLKDHAVQMKLLHAMYGSLGHGVPASCFDPRHGIHAVHNGQTVDILICFECAQVYSYSSFGTKSVSTGDGARPVFEQVFAEAALPKAAD
jgi:hypothetical protein